MIILKIYLTYKHPNRYKVDFHLRVIIGKKVFKKSEFKTVYIIMKVNLFLLLEKHLIYCLYGNWM